MGRSEPGGLDAWPGRLGGVLSTLFQSMPVLGHETFIP